MKLFIWHYDNECDYCETHYIQAKDKETALRMWADERYSEYCQYEKQHRDNPPYRVPKLTFEEWKRSDQGEYSRPPGKCIAEFEVAPNNNPSIW
jgi:hypothetical protein